MWDFAGCVVEHNGKRTNDWYTIGAPVQMIRDWGKNWGLLEYDDWDWWAGTNAGIFLIKKHAWEKAGWNNLDYYPGNDDLICCNDLEMNGMIPRFNPFAKTIALSYNTAAVLRHKKNSKKLWAKFLKNKNEMHLQ